MYNSFTWNYIDIIIWKNEFFYRSLYKFDFLSCHKEPLFLPLKLAVSSWLGRRMITLSKIAYWRSSLSFSSGCSWCVVVWSWGIWGPFVGVPGCPKSLEWVPRSGISETCLSTSTRASKETRCARSDRVGWGGKDRNWDTTVVYLFFLLLDQQAMLLLLINNALCRRPYGHRPNGTSLSWVVRWFFVRCLPSTLDD